MSHRALGLLALAVAGASSVSGQALSPTIERAPSRASARATVAGLPATPPVTHRRAVPTRVVIPTIGVNARVVELGLDDTGALEVPTTRDDAGWFTGGARPGDVGPAVIAGHVSLARGPAVFRDLTRLRRGDAIAVHAADGRVIRFTVMRSEQYAKDAFPTSLVYGPTTGRELRLITCGGEVDPATGRFRDNVVVFATTGG